MPSQPAQPCAESRAAAYREKTIKAHIISTQIDCSGRGAKKNAYRPVAGLPVDIISREGGSRLHRYLGRNVISCPKDSKLRR